MEITREMLELATAKANHAQLIVMYDAMKAERDAMAAQVEALRATLDECAEEFELNGEHDNRVYTLVKVALAAPTQHHLAEIRAEAVKEFARKLGDAFILPHSLRKETQKAEFYKAGWRDAFLFANQYADQIRREHEPHSTWLRDSNVNGGRRQGGTK